MALHAVAEVVGYVTHAALTFLSAGDSGSGLLAIANSRYIHMLIPDALERDISMGLLRGTKPLHPPRGQAPIALTLRDRHRNQVTFLKETASTTPALLKLLEQSPCLDLRLLLDVQLDAELATLDEGLFDELCSRLPSPLGKRYAQTETLVRRSLYQAAKQKAGISPSFDLAGRLILDVERLAQAFVEVVTAHAADNERQPKASVY